MSEPINIHEFTKRTTPVVYPYLKVLEPNNTTPLIVSVLEKGDMPLIIELDGIRKVVARISKSAFNIDKLLRTCGSLELYVGEGNSIMIREVTDYLEVFKWT